ncbi:hypothetical protein LCGC14_1871370 [marine sediment metagenome]|uniref:Uncharacterized protein n=1 Tax=marine sediment metagenome TaxID=412755 RepID=A0A0F9J3Q7_9ZZZZ
MNNEANQIKHRLEDEFGNILVRRVIKRNDWAAEAIFDIAAGDKKEWTPIEWAAVLCDLERCQLKVTDWLDGDENG